MGMGSPGGAGQPLEIVEFDPPATWLGRASPAWSSEAGGGCVPARGRDARGAAAHLPRAGWPHGRHRRPGRVVDREARSAAFARRAEAPTRAARAGAVQAVALDQGHAAGGRPSGYPLALATLLELRYAATLALGPGARVVVARDALGVLLAALRDEGYTLVGPTVRDGAIVYREIAGAGDLPIGGAKLRAVAPTGSADATTMPCSATTSAPTPGRSGSSFPRVRQWEAHRDGTGFRIDAETPRAPRLALIGARSCDHAEVRLPDPTDLLAQRRITLRPLRELIGIARPRRGRVVRRRGDRQYRADRLDPVGGPLAVDERDHHFGRQSSSAWAKYADALRRISFAGAAPDSRAPDPGVAPARCSSTPCGRRGRTQPVGPTSATSPASSPSSPRSTRSPPTATQRIRRR